MYKIKVGLFNPKEGTPSFCMLYKTRRKVFPASEQTQLDSSTDLLVALERDTIRLASFDFEPMYGRPKFSVCVILILVLLGFLLVVVFRVDDGRFPN